MSAGATMGGGKGTGCGPEELCPLATKPASRPVVTSNVAARPLERRKAKKAKAKAVGILASSVYAQALKPEPLLYTTLKRERG